MREKMKISNEIDERAIVILVIQYTMALWFMSFMAKIGDI